MSQPAARIMDFHTCPLVLPPGPFLPPVAHVGGPVVSGQPNVLVAMSPAARVTDMCTCAGVPDLVLSGAFNVLIGNMPAARMGDSTLHWKTRCVNAQTGASVCEGLGTRVYAHINDDGTLKAAKIPPDMREALTRFDEFDKLKPTDFAAAFDL